MTGGSATHAGIGFQDRVAGLLAVHLVADAPVEFFGLPSDVTPTSIELETSAPVDDILVATSAAGFCFLNVKRSVTLVRTSIRLSAHRFFFCPTEQLAHWTLANYADADTVSILDSLEALDSGPWPEKVPQ